MALEVPASDYFLLFCDTGVYKLPLLTHPDCLPRGTWALSDSNQSANQPCSTFLGASGLKNAWIIQATSPLEGRWKDWQKCHNADTFIMDYFSIREMIVLG